MVEIAQLAFSALVKAQTQALKRRAGEEASKETTAESTLDWSLGKDYLHALLKSAGVNELRLQACESMAQDDSQFDFLDSLPDSAAIGHCRCICGKRSDS